MARINKCIELLAQGQPIYLTHPTALSYAAGQQDAKTWADMLLLDFEHEIFTALDLEDQCVENPGQRFAIEFHVHDRADDLYDFTATHIRFLTWAA